MTLNGAKSHVKSINNEGSPQKIENFSQRILRNVKRRYIALSQLDARMD